MEEKNIENVKLNKIKKWFTDNYCYVLPALIISIIMLAIFIAEEITPFGHHSLTIVDSIHQYVPFFSDYRHKILNGENMLYTWDVALGSNFLSLGAYYFSSPFNLLLLLFPQEALVAGVCIIVSIKIALTGTTMAIYLSKSDLKIFGREEIACRKEWYIVGLSLMYALSNYVVGYYWNTMWMDCIMIFPIIMLGFNKLMEKGRPLLYCLTLFYALFCNYYIGFMICVFLVLYFFVYNHGGIKKFFLNGIKFGICSLIAGGMSAVLLVPAYYGISATASAKTKIPKWSWYESFTAIFKQHMSFTYPLTNQIFDGGVNLFCGTLVIFTVILFIFTKGIKISDKIKTIMLLAFLLISFNSTTLNYIWHGFHDQYGIPNRFSFLYIFVLVDIAYRVINRIEEIKPRYSFVSLIAALIFITAVYINEMKNIKVIGVVVTLLFVFFYALLFMVRQYKSMKPEAFSLIIAGVMSIEMVVSSINGFMENGYFDYWERYSESKNVHAAYARSEELADESDGFYRTELMDSTVLDEATWYNMRSVGTFCSTVLGDLVTTMGKMGFYTGANEFLYMGATPFTSSLLNVKYLMMREGDLNNFDFNYVETVENVGIYENPYPLSIGFAVDNNVKDWDFSGVERLNMQNSLAYDMTGVYGPFSLVYPELTATSDTCDVSVSRTVVSFTPRQPGRATHTESFTVSEDGDYYVNCRGNHITKIRFSINGEEYAYDRYQIQIFHLGKLKAGDFVNVEFVYDNPPTETTTAVVAIAKFDQELYEQIYQELYANIMTNVTYSEGHVEGTITMPEEKTLFMSIPYDEGWTLYIDGEKANYYKIMGAFIGIDVPIGTHEIELDYTPKGFKEGVKISVVCWLMMLLVVLLFPRLHRKIYDAAKSNWTIQIQMMKQMKMIQMLMNCIQKRMKNIVKMLNITLTDI